MMNSVRMVLILGIYGGIYDHLKVRGSIVRYINVINGEKAEESEFPFQVSLQQGEQHVCGATVLSESWILTAAHCIYGKNLQSYRIRAGSSNIYHGGKLHALLKAITHKYFDNVTPYNDIAVILIFPPMEFGKNLQRTILPGQWDTVPVHSPSIAIGWGGRCGVCPLIPELQKAELFTYSEADCVKFHGFRPKIDLICSGNPEELQGICFGDSGGALLVNDIQVGIASWVTLPCNEKPAAWTKVSSYRYWIRRHTGV